MIIQIVLTFLTATPFLYGRISAVVPLMKTTTGLAEFSTRNDDNDFWTIDSHGTVAHCNSDCRIVSAGWSPDPLILKNGGVINRKPVKIAAASDGWTWMLTEGPDNIYRFDPNVKKWENIPGGLIEISAWTKNKAIGISPDKSLWELPNNVNVNPEMNGKAKSICMGAAGSKWLVTTESFLYRLNSTIGQYEKDDPQNVATVNCYNNKKLVITTNTGNAFHTIQDGWIHSQGGVWRAIRTVNVILTLTETGDLYNKLLSPDVP